MHKSQHQTYTQNTINLFVIRGFCYILVLYDFNLTDHSCHLSFSFTQEACFYKEIKDTNKVQANCYEELCNTDTSRNREFHIEINNIQGVRI